MKRIVNLSALLCLGLALVTGCADPKPSNSMEGVDPQKLADYEKMMAEDEAGADTDGDDVESE